MIAALPRYGRAQDAIAHLDQAVAENANGVVLVLKDENGSISFCFCGDFTNRDTAWAAAFLAQESLK